MANYSINVTADNTTLISQGESQTILASPFFTVGDGGGGTSDHGALTGLADDDHTQYALADGSRGNFEPTGTATTAISTHIGQADPHAQYALESSLGTAAAADSSDFATAALILTAGTGLAGGGNLTANRTFALDAPTLASLALADDAVQRGDFATHVETFLDSATAAAARAAISANNAAGLTTGTLPDARLSAAVAASLALADSATQPGDLATVATSGAYSDLSGLPNLAAKADLVGGVVPSSQIPAIAVTEYLGSVANEAAMLALTGQAGDFCTRVDTGSPWMLTDSDATLLANWIQFIGPGAPVSSVNGQTGVVTLGAADVGAETTAQLNDRDTANRNRANHAGTQAQSTITDLVSDLAGKKNTLTTLTGVTEHAVSLQSIAGSSQFTVFSLSGAYEVVAGSVFGPVVGVRITIDGGIPVDLDSVAAMYPSGTTNLISIAPVPPVRCTTSLQVEIMNLSAGTQSCGAKIYTRVAT